MPATVTSITPRRTSGPSRTPAPHRRPFRDNPRLILAGIGVLVAALIALLVIAGGTSRFSPDFLSEFVLYGLSAADLTMLAALLFVLARNIIKLVVERRRALPFAKFRAKLVALLLGMTLVPAVLVLAVGSELIRTSVERWFNAPMDEILASANQIAGDYYHERQLLVADHAARLAHAIGASDLVKPDLVKLRELIEPDITGGRLQRVAVYRVPAAAAAAAALDPVFELTAQALTPASQASSAVARLAAEAARDASDGRAIGGLGAAGDLLHAAS